MEGVPSLDTEEIELSKASILEDENLGANTNERLQALEDGKKVAKILTIVSCTTCGWAFFYPKLYVLLMLILLLLPWIALAIAWKSKGLFRVDEFKNDQHPNIALALMLPSLAVMLRTLFDLNVVQTLVSVMLYLIISLLLTLAIFIVDPASRHKVASALSLFVLSLAYGYGATNQINTLLDKSPGIAYRTTVQGKHVSKGKQDTYILELRAWGPYSESKELDVHKKLYELLNTGDVVQMTIP